MQKPKKDFRQVKDVASTGYSFPGSEVHSACQGAGGPHSTSFWAQLRFVLICSLPSLRCTAAAWVWAEVPLHGAAPKPVPRGWAERGLCQDLLNCPSISISFVGGRDFALIILSASQACGFSSMRATLWGVKRAALPVWEPGPQVQPQSLKALPGCWPVRATEPTTTSKQSWIIPSNMRQILL